MSTEFTRRHVIGAGIGMGITATATAQRLGSNFFQAAAPGIPTWRTELRKLAPNVYAYIQEGGPNLEYIGVSNAGVFTGNDSITLFDTLGGPMQIKALLAAAQQEIPGKSVKRIIYSHHHTDHIEGAQFFPGIDIVATEFCRKTIAEMAPLDPKWAPRPGFALGGEPHLRIPPTMILEGESLTYYCGNTVVKAMVVGHAHTYGDIIAYLPEEKVVFLSDVGFFYVTPYAHWADITNWINVLNKVLDMDVTTIIPGHGPIGGKRELEAQRDYLVLFQKEARKRFDEGLTPGKAAASMPSFGKYDAWKGAKDRLPLNTVRAFHEFAHTATPEMDVEGTNKANDEFFAITGYRPTG